MITREDLIEKAAEAFHDEVSPGKWSEKSDIFRAYTRQEVKIVIRIALEVAADIADEYAIAQPSFDPKQHAAYEIANDIRSLIPESDNG